MTDNSGTPVQDRAGKAWETLDEAVAQSLGFASTCWENMMGTGQFDSTSVKAAMDELLEFARKGVLDPGRSKGEAIVEDCLLRDEPFFVFRARDIFSIAALHSYLNILEQMGPYNPEFHEGVTNSVAEIRNWQTENVRSVKYPD